ncbi:hypothetical protein [Dactylosporangium fulvum]|uniref:PH domain-containing protein n=1 Tax=Dactylosporangium fulvum TaxID=53359 RepID=A0ABY5WAQ2_9ACTN|nr:hypothetical protein [Dactylosporangium fulvum]UWP85151.1 hypothetical protein Dfulv_13335 [Dactylosporangium fulvum]
MDLELRIPQGRANRRLVVVVGGLAVVCGVLAFTDLPIATVAAAFAVGLGIPAVLAALAGRGADPALTVEGIRLKAFPFDRTQVVVPWREVERTWIATLGAYDYLFVVPRDPARYRRGRGFVRPAVMSLTSARHGTALQIYLPADGVSKDRIRTAMAQFSAGTVHVGPAPV